MWRCPITWKSVLRLNCQVGQPSKFIVSRLAVWHWWWWWWLMMVHLTIPNVWFNGEASFVFLLQYDQLRLANVSSQHVHLTVHRPRQLLLDRLRLAVGKRHLTAEPGVRLEYLTRCRQLDFDLNAGRARLLDGHRTRRPRCPLSAERVSLLAIRPVGEGRLEQNVGRRRLTGNAWRGRFRLVDGVIMGELNTSPVNLVMYEVLLQQTSLFPCRFSPEVVDRPVLDQCLNVNLWFCCGSTCCRHRHDNSTHAINDRLH